MLKQMAMATLAALALTMAAGMAQAQSQSKSPDPHGAANMPGNMGPATVPQMSTPYDCAALSDEISRLDKFAKSPAATPKQIAANTARSDKLKEKLADMQADDKCPQPAAPATK